MGLLKSLKECKPDRKKYRVNPILRFEVDKRDYCISFFPTVVWSPWIYRYPNMLGVVDIWWLHYHIVFGKWEPLSCKNCKHQDECVKSKRINWYGDDVFENGEKCTNFEAKY